MESFHQLDILIEVQCTFDANLIKVEENPVALRQAPHQPTLMPEMFTPASPPEVPSTTTKAATTEGTPPQTEKDVKGAHYFYSCSTGHFITYNTCEHGLCICRIYSGHGA